MSVVEDRLSAAHKMGCAALGEIALALATRRGVTRAKLAEWAKMLREAAEELR